MAKLNVSKLVGKKLLIGGIQGTGKTYLARKLAKNFKCMVYTPHMDEWSKENVYLVRPTDFVSEFPQWCKLAKAYAEKGVIDCFVIDECDLLWKSHFDSSYEFKDVIINHRHFGKKGLAIFAMTRRIQDIPAAYYGTFENMALFFIESPQTTRLLDEYAAELGQKVKGLNYDRHEFILKMLGQEPIIAVA